VRTRHFDRRQMANSQLLPVTAEQIICRSQRSCCNLTEFCKLTRQVHHHHERFPACKAGLEFGSEPFTSEMADSIGERPPLITP
jgi:hypothetical protein